jgi:MFS family permease
VGTGRTSTWAAGRGRSRCGLLLALAIDNVGSGLFLPLVLVHSIRVIGLSVASASSLLFLGTMVGLAAPLVVGAVVERVGARRVVIASQLVQAAGMACYLLAGAGGSGNGGAVALAVAGAVLVATGTQTFYSSLFSLISAVAGEGPKDGAFAHVDMVRSAAFGLGALAAAALLSWLDTPALRIAVAVDALSFLLAAALIWRLVAADLTVHRPHDASGTPQAVGAASVQATHRAAGVDSNPRPWRDRPFLVLLVMIALTGLAVDVFLLGFPVWALDRLHAPAWVPGACVVLLTAISSTSAGQVVRWTSSWLRTRTVALGALLTIVWAAMCAAAPLISATWQPVWLLVATVVLALSALLVGTRVMAMAEASAPERAHGRYLATVQYSFNVAQLLAPLLVGLFALALWLPWAAVALAGAVALLLLPWLGRRLPSSAVSAQTAPAVQPAVDGAT